jgi:hypothetical protein
VLPLDTDETSSSNNNPEVSKNAKANYFSTFENISAPHTKCAEDETNLSFTPILHKLKT